MGMRQDAGTKQDARTEQDARTRQGARGRQDAGTKQDMLVAVLAAGAARRMGVPKQLCTLAGKSLVVHACACACAVHDAQAAVVVGAQGDAVAREVARFAPAPGDAAPCVLRNDAWAEGQASSVRLAAAFAQRKGMRALMLMPADMPFLSASHLRALAQAARLSGKPIAASKAKSANIITAPCVFDASCFDALQSLQGDCGAVALVRQRAKAGDVAVVPFDNERALFDVDTPEDLKTARHLMERQ